MLAYQLRLAWRSLLRNPVLSAVIVVGIALGIGVSMTFVTAYYFVSGDPIPHKSRQLFYVQLDAWNPQRPYDREDPSEPPDQLTYMDAVAIRESDIPTYQTGMYKTYLTLHPEGKDLRPFREDTRMCFADFFRLFDVPFRYGGPWGPEADAGPQQVVVLGDELNQRLFGGADSVGRRVRIEDREFEVVGVIAPWHPSPKYYDTQNDEFGEPEALFMPFHLGSEMRIYTSGNTSGWKSWGPEYEGLLQSEAIWIQYWVQLDSPQQKEAYAAFLDGYVDEQKKAGRFGRPKNNRLRDVREWLAQEEVVPGEARALLVISILFLLVCSVNLIGILLGKFLGRSAEVGVRRALGASRRWVFVQHLIECELIGVIGCALGLGLTVLGLRILDRLFEARLNFQLDPTMLVVALGLALLSAMVAGIYPAWRICRLQPGLHLKLQ